MPSIKPHLHAYFEISNGGLLHIDEITGEQTYIQDVPQGMPTYDNINSLDEARDIIHYWEETRREFATDRLVSEYSLTKFRQELMGTFLPSQTFAETIRRTKLQSERAFLERLGRRTRAAYQPTPTILAAGTRRYIKVSPSAIRGNRVYGEKSPTMRVIESETGHEISAFSVHINGPSDLVYSVPADEPEHVSVVLGCGPEHEVSNAQAYIQTTAELTAYI